MTNRETGSETGFSRAKTEMLEIGEYCVGGPRQTGARPLEPSPRVPLLGWWVPLFDWPGLRKIVSVISNNITLMQGCWQ